MKGDLIVSARGPSPPATASLHGLCARNGVALLPMSPGTSQPLGLHQVLPRLMYFVYPAGGFQDGISRACKVRLGSAGAKTVALASRA